MACVERGAVLKQLWSTYGMLLAAALQDKQAAVAREVAANAATADALQEQSRLAQLQEDEKVALRAINERHAAKAEQAKQQYEQLKQHHTKVGGARDHECTAHPYSWPATCSKALVRTLGMAGLQHVQPPCGYNTVLPKWACMHFEVCCQQTEQMAVTPAMDMHVPNLPLPTGSLSLQLQDLLARLSGAQQLVGRVMELETANQQQVVLEQQLRAQLEQRQEELGAMTDREAHWRARAEAVEQLVQQQGQQLGCSTPRPRRDLGLLCDLLEPHQQQLVEQALIAGVSICEGRRRCTAAVWAVGWREFRLLMFLA